MFYLQSGSLLTLDKALSSALFFFTLVHSNSLIGSKKMFGFSHKPYEKVSQSVSQSVSQLVNLSVGWSGFY